ncbi:MAG: gamma-glutamyl-gamma-aminobutyrate hydrolase family protein, partial [Rhodopirellula sp.]|nr:gamma-glutamyl-gamma-aminobutyrate hydrolase family protein [Rhodopirellula sp.]
IEEFGPKVPVLGVCLGHQCIAEVYGGKVVRHGRLMHGKVSPMLHDGRGVFAGIKSPCLATRYHSLIALEESLPDCLEVTAWAEWEGHPREVMGLRHREYSVHGVQFHPESYLTAEPGIQMLRNFLAF